MEFQESRTRQNLMAAIAGEAQARSKYTAYAKQAQTDGYEQIAALFWETAENEQAHARLWFDYVHQKGATLDNLRDAAGGEHYEWSEMYRAFAEEAQAEGFGEIAAKLRLVAGIEKEHETRYNRLIADLESKTVFQKPQNATWICRNCGYVHSATEAFAVCPVCGYPRSFAQVRAENY